MNIYTTKIVKKLICIWLNSDLNKGNLKILHIKKLNWIIKTLLVSAIIILNQKNNKKRKNSQIIMIIKQNK